MLEIKDVKKEILVIREENVDEKFKAFIQVLDKDSSSSAFYLNVSPPWLWQENQTGSVQNFR